MVGLQLDFMIFKVFSNLSNSMILINYFKQKMITKGSRPSRIHFHLIFYIYILIFTEKTLNETAVEAC